MEDNKTFQFEQHENVNGISYMCIGTSFTDARNVYLADTTKVGIITFVDRKPVYNGYKHEVSRYTKGFVFEAQQGVSISCKDYQKIAKYVYKLNDRFKNYKIEK